MTFVKLCNSKFLSSQFPPWLACLTFYALDLVVCVCVVLENAMMAINLIVMTYVRGGFKL